MSNIQEESGLPDLPHTYRYRIADATESILDGRKNKTPAVDHRHVYFVGNRVLVDGEVYYYLSVLFADDNGSFTEAMDQVQQQLRSRLKQSTHCALVYVRSLYSFDKALMAAADRHHITTEMDAMPLADDMEQCIVFGILGTNTLFMQAAYADDALAGIGFGESIAAKSPDKHFTPLRVCLTQPVSIFMDEMAECNVEELKAFIAMLPEPGTIRQ